MHSHFRKSFFFLFPRFDIYLPTDPETTQIKGLCSISKVALTVHGCFILRVRAATSKLLHMDYKAMLIRPGDVVEMQSG